MNPWSGKRTIAVVTACMTSHGMPTFVRNTVEITHDEYENGSHYALAEIRLVAQDYEEPFVHFDQFEAPAFLHPAVEEHVSLCR